MKLLTGLFRSARKKLQLTHDNDMGAFREKLNALVEQKDSLGDDEIQTKVEEIKSILDDLPDGDDKSKLVRFLEDFKNVKEQDANVAKKAAGEVADLFEKLDTEAMQDTPENVGNDSEDTNEVVEKIEEETKEPSDEDSKDEESDEEVSDADPNPQYSLEEIYQFIKKRMAEESGDDSEEPAESEDAACEEDEEETEDGDEESEEDSEDDSEEETEDSDDEDESDEETEDSCDEDDEKSDEEVVTDHAPRISIRMTKDSATHGGLYEMFEKIKRGER